MHAEIASTPPLLEMPVKLSSIFPLTIDPIIFNLFWVYRWFMLGIDPVPSLEHPVRLGLHCRISHRGNKDEG
jgi:hypothetical protein